MINRAEARKLNRQVAWYYHDGDDDPDDTIQHLDAFFGMNWGRADARDVFYPNGDDHQVVIYNAMLRTWLPLLPGWFVIRGLHGEFWPVDRETFEELYETE